MVDACSLQQTQRLPDVFCRSCLAGMGDREEVVLACSLEDVDKLRWWMADFVRIESYSGDVFPIWQRLLRGVEGRLDTQMSQKAHDQARGDAIGPLALDQRPADTSDHRRKWDPALGMGLWIEEDFGVLDMLGVGTFCRYAMVRS